MKQRLVSDAIWNDIAALAKKAVVRRAAVAYVTDVESIPFQAGDTLITDASDSSISHGSTNAPTLARLVAAKVEVFSVRGLHAKVMRLDDTVVVGSGNLSRRSRDQLIEAAIISSDEKLVAQVDAFIDSLRDSGERLTKKSMTRLLAIPVIKRVMDGSIREKQVSVEGTSVWILGLPDIEVNANEEAVEKEIAEITVEEGPEMEVNQFYWPKSYAFTKAAKKGDLVISIYRPDYDDLSPKRIKVYRPMWVKSIIPAGRKRHVGFVYAMPRNIADKTVSWVRFIAMAERAGIHGLTPDCEVQLSDRQWRMLSAEWTT